MSVQGQQEGGGNDKTQGEEFLMQGVESLSY